MPIINTNDPYLHKELKVEVAGYKNLTLGKAVENAVKFCLTFGLINVDEGQIKVLKTTLEQRGWNGENLVDFLTLKGSQ